MIIETTKTIFIPQHFNGWLSVGQYFPMVGWYCFSGDDGYTCKARTLAALDNTVVAHYQRKAKRY